MKRTRNPIILSWLAGMMLLAGRAAAQPATSYVTGMQIANLNSAPVLVSAFYYAPEDGALVEGGPAGDAIAGSSAATVYPVLPNFNGSVVVSPGQNLAVMAELRNEADTAGAAYTGFAMPSGAVALPIIRSAGTPRPGYRIALPMIAAPGAAPADQSAGPTNLTLQNSEMTLALPRLMKAGGNMTGNTWFTVQNISTSEVQVTVTYSDPGCVPVTLWLKPYASQTLSQGAEVCHTQTVFPARVSTAGRIVAAVVEENGGRMLAYRALSPQETAATPAMPLIHFGGEFATEVLIQNTASVPTEVTVSYFPALAGSACTETQNIPAYSARSFALAAFTTGNVSGASTCAPGPFIGSASVTGNSAGVPLAVVVSQTAAKAGETYAAINPAQATPKVLLPWLASRGLSTTGFAVMNAGAAPTYVRCALSDAGYTPAAYLQPHAALIINHAGQTGARYTGVGTCSAYTDDTYTQVDDNARIAAVAIELGSLFADRMLLYPGVNTMP